MNFEALVGRPARTVSITVQGTLYVVLEPSVLQMLDFRTERTDSFTAAVAKLLFECVRDPPTRSPAFTLAQANALAASVEPAGIIPFVNAIFGFAPAVAKGKPDEKKADDSLNPTASNGASPLPSDAPAASSSPP